MKAGEDENPNYIPRASPSCYIWATALARRVAFSREVRGVSQGGRLSSARERDHNAERAKGFGRSALCYYQVRMTVARFSDAANAPIAGGKKKALGARDRDGGYHGFAQADRPLWRKSPGHWRKSEGFLTTVIHRCRSEILSEVGLISSCLKIWRSRFRVSLCL